MTIAVGAARGFLKDRRVARLLTFDIQARAAAGRIGRFKTAHGTVTTPTLLPVVNPNIELVAPSEMRDRFGCEMVITNSYVMHKHEHLRTRALTQGVHKTIGWDGPVMTDSGTFQMYVYGDVKVGPEEIVAFQADMGVDVATCLDLFVTPEMSRQEAEEAVRETVARTHKSAEVLAKRRQAPEGAGHASTVLNTTVQGGIFPDLRQECAAAYRGLDAGYTTIGSVVPLMERQMYPELVEAILHSQSQLRKDRPVHLFGAGHPLVFPLATALGCDLFDSSSYAKYAKDGRIMVPEGTLHVEDLEEWPFSSGALDGWSPQEITNALEAKSTKRPLEGEPWEAATRIKQREADEPRFAAERALALHNLDVCFADIRRIRQAIRHGTLWELVEQRAAAHPFLAAATRRLADPLYQEWLEHREPLSGHKALRYTGSLTHGRPIFRRIATRIATRFTPLGEPVPAAMQSPYAEAGQEKREAAMHKEPKGKPFGAGIGPLDADQDHVIISALGPTPVGLDEAYPFAQSVLPRLDGLDRGHMGWVGECKDAWLAAHDLMPGIPGPGLPGEALDRDMLQVVRTADWQFGSGAGVVLAGLLEPTDVRRLLTAAPGQDALGDAAHGAASTGPKADAGSLGAAPQVSGAAAEAPQSPVAHARESAGRPAVAHGQEGTVAPGPEGTALADPELFQTPAAAISDALQRPLASPLRCERSRATGKMRTVHLDEHVLSLRAADGLWTLKPAGARLLHAALPAPRMRVTVAADSVPFNRDGKSVFAQFVVACDPGLRPGDECLVVDEADELVAVGQLLLAPDEVGDFQHGMAVKVRDGIA